MKRNDDVDARPAAARNCPITRSSWHISRPGSHFPSLIVLFFPLSLSLYFFFFFFSYCARVCTRTPGPARREAQSQREIKSINMWEAHATHSSVCSTRNNLRVSSSRANGRARTPVPREVLVLRLDTEASIPRWCFTIVHVFGRTFDELIYASSDLRRRKSKCNFAPVRLTREYATILLRIVAFKFERNCRKFSLQKKRSCVNKLNSFNFSLFTPLRIEGKWFR